MAFRTLMTLVHRDSIKKAFFVIVAIIAVFIVEINYFHSINLGIWTASMLVMASALLLISFYCLPLTISQIKEKLNSEKFASFHLLFFIGITLLILSRNNFSWTPTLLNIFTIGSFSLLISGFFLTSEREILKNKPSVLLYSCASSLIMFISGAIPYVYEVVTGGSSYPSVVGMISSSLFLLGLADLIVVSVSLFIVAYDWMRQ